MVAQSLSHARSSSEPLLNLSSLPKRFFLLGCRSGFCRRGCAVPARDVSKQPFSGSP